MMFLLLVKTKEVRTYEPQELTASPKGLSAGGGSKGRKDKDGLEGHGEVWKGQNTLFRTSERICGSRRLCRLL
jgi:hypothetical protein